MLIGSRTHDTRVCIPSVLNYKIFYFFPELDVCKRALVCLFTHFSLYIVYLEYPYFLNNTPSISQCSAHMFFKI